MSVVSVPLDLQIVTGLVPIFSSMPNTVANVDKAVLQVRSAKMEHASVTKAKCSVEKSVSRLPLMPNTVGSAITHVKVANFVHTENVPLTAPTKHISSAILDALSQKPAAFTVENAVMPVKMVKLAPTAIVSAQVNKSNVVSNVLTSFPTKSIVASAKNPVLPENSVSMESARTIVEKPIVPIVSVVALMWKPTNIIAENVAMLAKALNSAVVVDASVLPNKIDVTGFV